ncbi:MAG: IS200/IS605 family transposase [Acidobacteria bacterium]|nr:IS200/IS605 family transposase [Acidobacteriota bacterium]
MAHTYTDLLIHVLFSTEKRQPFLDKELRPKLFNYMSGILKRIGCTPLLINGINDHVHALFVIPPTLCVAEVIEKLKANSSKWVHETFPHKRHFAWQAGYTAFSVSPSNRKRVLRYIAGQEEHHRRRSYQEEVLAFLEKSGIAVDPRWGLE